MGPPLSDSLPLVLVLLVLIVLAAFLGAAEAALLRVPKIRAEVKAESGDRAARRVARLVSDLTHTMNAVLLLVLLVQVGAATIAGIVAERHFGNTGVTIGSVIVTLVMFVYAEAIPKTIAVRRPLRVAMLVAPAVSALTTLVRPIVSLLVRFADLQAPGSGVETGVTVTEAELIRLAAAAEAEGAIEPTDRELIERAFVVGDILIGEILVPRVDVIGVPGVATSAEALDSVAASGHRRLPVYGEDLDDIKGIVRIRDLAQVAGEEPERPVIELISEPLIVPESRRVIDVLRDMQRERKSMAVVIDEYGGTAGVVTVEDIVAELVGEIGDDDTSPVPEIRASGAGHWMVAGTTDLRELAAATGIEPPEGDYSTVAGMVIAIAGQIPPEGERIQLAGFEFIVTRATRRRIQQIEVIRQSG